MKFKTKKGRVSGSSLLAILVFAFLTIDCFVPVHATALIGLEVGDDPKEIVLNDLDGKTVNVADYIKEKPIILVFWELTVDKSFLNYSLDELLFLNELYGKYHDKEGLEIFGIYTPEDDKKIPDTEIADVRNLISSNKIKFPILIDKGFKFFREYGVIALPSTIMVGKTGKIEFIYPSFPVTARPVILERVRELIGVAKVERKTESVKQRGSDSRSHILYRYALQMYKKGLLEQAFSSLKKSIDLDPYNSWAHNLKGVILWKRGDSQGATDEFKRAIALDKNIVAHLNYTILLFEQGQHKEAEEFLTSAPSTHIEFRVRSHYLLGLIYRDTNRIDQAVSEIELANSLLEVRASEKEDSHLFTFSFRIPMLRDLSELYRRKGEDKKAMELLLKAVDLALGFEDRPGTGSLSQRKGMMLHE